PGSRPVARPGAPAGLRRAPERTPGPRLRQRAGPRGARGARQKPALTPSAATARRSGPRRPDSPIHAPAARRRRPGPDAARRGGGPVQPHVEEPLAGGPARADPGAGPAVGPGHRAANPYHSNPAGAGAAAGGPRALRPPRV